MSNISTNLSPKLALEMLQRMRNDYHNQDLFEQLCQDDPTIETRYHTLLSIVGNHVDIWADSSDISEQEEQALSSTTAKTQQTPSVAPITSNWDYRSELLKLYILGRLSSQTIELQNDKNLTATRIEEFGNRHRKQKRISAQQLLDNEKKKALVGFGVRVADAQLLFATDPFRSKQEMEDLKKEIYDTENKHNELNMWRMRKIANQRYFDLKKKYGC